MSSISADVFILAHKTHNFLLPGFAYLFNKYWSPTQKVNLFADERLTVPLPSNFKFTKISSYEFDHWSDSLFDVLGQMQSDFVVMFLEDYWLKDYVKIRHIHTLINFIKVFDGNVLRVDLTLDRASQSHEVFSQSDDITIIETPHTSPYQMSFQTAIWSRKNLLSLLRLGETAHDAEVKGSERMREFPRDKMRVFGTLSSPVRYAPIYRFKRRQLNLAALPKSDLQEVYGVYEENAISLNPFERV